MKTIIFICLVLLMILACFSFKEESKNYSIVSPSYIQHNTYECDLDEFKRHFNSSSKLADQVLDDLRTIHSDNHELREEHDAVMKNYNMLMIADSTDNKINYLTDK